ncbi:hypothetical protein, partial [Enterobacter hormaechei]|uniref:hypothetical protein n=1 Tax=Enterobacter hormaechei TaxID=158836 RepID=UPI00203DCE06
LCNGFKENEINCTLLQGTVTNGKNSDPTSTFVMLRKGFKSCILVLLLIAGWISFCDARISFPASYCSLLSQQSLSPL